MHYSTAFIIFLLINVNDYLYTYRPRVQAVPALVIMFKDPLQYFPVDKWTDIQNAFMADWPRGMSGYTVLETQRKLIKQGFGYGFQVYCPYGDYWNGMVAVNEKSDFYEIIIHSPRNDTEKLEESLRKTKKINWERRIILPFAPQHIVECVRRAIQDVDVEIGHILPSEAFILVKETQLFQYVSLPPNITFGQLTLDNLELLDSTWPHRYPTSPWYFELLIKNNNGYGLFLNNSLISWVLINEAGNLLHLYTMDNYRQKGYAEVLLKLVCNIELKDGRHVSAYCVKGNVNACKLYRKLGFKDCEGVAWCYLNKKT